MTPAQRIRVGFGIAAVLSFLAATNGSDVIARMEIAGVPFGAAVSQSFYWTLKQLFGALFLLLPFVVVALLSAWVAKGVNALAASFLFTLSLAALAWLYFLGHWHAQLSLQEQKWTAASLSVGLLPFKSAAILALSAASAALLVGIGHVWRKWRVHRET